MRINFVVMFIVFSICGLFSFSNHTLVSTKGLWFNGTTTLKSNAHSDFIGKSILTLHNMQTSRVSAGSFSELEMTVSSSGVYYSKIYNSYWWGNDELSTKTVCVKRDDYTPEVSFRFSSIYKQRPTSLDLIISDTANIDDLNPDGKGVITSYSVVIKHNGTQIGKCYYHKAKIVDMYEENLSVSSTTTPRKFPANDLTFNLLEAMPTNDINGYYEIEVYAADAADNIFSEVYYFAIDNSSPTLEISHYNDNYDVTGGAVTVIASASDNMTDEPLVKWRYSSGLWQEFTGSITLTQNSVIEFKVTDTAANSSGLLYHYVNNIDTEPPSINFLADFETITKDAYNVIIDYTDNGSPHSSGIGVGSIAGVSSKKYKYHISDDWLDYEDPLNVDTNKRIYVMSEDSVGNTIGDDNETYIDINNFDQTPPYFGGFNTSADIVNGFTTGPVYVSASAMDDGISGEVVEVTNIEYIIDGDEDWSEYTGPVPVYSNTTINFRATDSLGNRSLDNAFFYIVNIIDSTPPTLTYSYDEHTYVKDYISVTVEDISDIQAGVYSVEYKIGDESWVEVLSENIVDDKFTFDVYHNNEVSIRSTDNVGNKTTDTYINFTVNNIDKINPEITKISLTNNDWTHESVGVIAEFEDGGDDDDVKSGINEKSALYRVGPNGDWKDFPMKEEDYLSINDSVTVKIYDNAGNSETDSIEISKIDTTPPTIKVSGNDDMWSKLHKTLTVIPEDHESGIKSKTLEYMDDSGVWLVYSGFVTVTSNQTIKFRVTNKAGLTETISVDVETVDSDFPIISDPFLNNNNIVSNILLLKIEHDVFNDVTSETTNSYYLHNSSTKLDDSDLSIITDEQWTVYTSSLDVSSELVSDGTRWIYFKSVDKANNTTYAGYSFLKDTTKPIVNSYYLTFNEEGSNDTSASSNITFNEIDINEENPVSLSYIITNSSGDTVQEGTILDLESGTTVDISKLPEGDYSTEIIVVDIADNYNDRGLVVKEFNIDRTPPSIEDVTLELYFGEKIFNENGIANSSGLNMLFSEQGNEIESPRYQFYITKDNPDVISDLDTKLMNYTTSSTIMFNEGIGLYYIYYYIFDDAGNRSNSYKCRTIRFNNKKLPIPEISGVKKAENLTDVITYNNPTFTFSPKLYDQEENIIDYGDLVIVGYDYKLYKGITANDSDECIYNEFVEISNASCISKTFTNLDDNAIGEYYTLFIRAKSNRGDYSSFTEPYNFRIDTRPPENLTVMSPSHQDPDTAYSSNIITFYWDNPQDMTGIASFNYYISEDGNGSEPGDNDLLKVNGDRKTLTYNLDDDKNSGSIFMYVEAIDHGGLINVDNTNTLEVKINRVIPAVEITSIDNFPKELKTTVYWNVSNAHYQTIVLENGETSITRTLNGDVNSFTLDGLVPEEVYTVKIYGYSNAQLPLSDMSSTKFVVNDETDSMIGSEETEFTTQFSGFRVDGMYETLDSSEATASLLLPDTVTLKDNELVIREIELSNIEIDSAGVFQSGKSNINFITTIHGFDISPGENNELYIEREKGLHLTNRVINYPINMSEYFTLTFSDLYVQDAIQKNLSGSAGNLSQDNSINIQTTVEDIDTWLIEDITEISLDGSYLKLNDGSVNVSGIADFTLSNVLLDNNREFVSGDITNNFLLSYGAYDDQIILRVTDAQLVEDELVILEATITDSDVYNAFGESIEIKISNLRLDQYGNIKTQPSLINQFYIKNGHSKQFYVDTLQFSSSGMKGSGYIVSGSTKISNSDFSDLGITSSGISSTFRGTLDKKLTFVTYDGYCVTASGVNVSITTEGYHLSSADIDLSVFEAGKTVTIYDLIINHNFTEILQSGSTNYYTEKNTTTLPNLSYYTSNNDKLNIEAIELTETGMVAKNVTMTLPENFSTASVVIEEIPMTIDAVTNLGIFGRGILKNNITSLVLSNGYKINPSRAYYENGQIKIPSYILDLPTGCDNSNPILNNMVFNHHGFTYDNFNQEIIFCDTNWTFIIHNPTFSTTGITGDTTLSMPVLDETQSINVDNFLLLSNGDFTLDKTETLESYINIGGYGGVIDGIEISETSLKIDVLTFNFQGFELQIEDLVLNASGNIIDYGKGSVVSEFISRNGFILNEITPTFNSDGLSISGKVQLPEYFGDNNSISVDNNELKLDTEWNLLTDKITEEHTVEINGVSATIDDFIFMEDGLFIESTTVFETDQEISISNALITAGNRIISGGYLNETHISRRIVGWPLVVTSAHLIDDGVELASVIELPEELGSPTVYLDDMLLYCGDNIVKFRSNTVINALEFEINDIRFEMERVRLTPDYLSITNANIILPSNDTFDGQTIGLSYLKIDKNGNFQLSGSEVAPISMWGLEVYIKNFSLGYNELNIEGAVQFPNDFSIYELAGQKVTLEEFNHNFNTNVTIFEVELDKIRVEIADGWTTEFSSLNISNSGFSIGQGELFFPDDWLDNISIESTGFTNLSYDFNTNNFDIDQIFINNLDVDCEGYQFTITSASYSGTTGFTLGGRFPLPGLFEGAAEDPVLVIETLQITDDFSIQQLIAGVNVSSLSFTENRELLFTGYIGVDTSYENLKVDLSGNFVVGSTFSVPSMIGSEIGIGTFQYDILNREITTLTASYFKTTQELFGLTVDDFLLGLSYSKANPVMTFYLGGSTQLPAYYPGIGEERFSLSGEFDTTGKLLAFSSGLTITKDKPLVSDLILKQDSNISMIALTNDSNELSGFEFSLNSAVVKYSDTFAIEKLQGGDINITSLIIDTNSGFKSCNMSFNTPADMNLLNDIVLKNGSITLSAEGTNKIQTNITGVMQLPESMGGMQVAIDTFTVDSSGNFEIDANGTITEATLFEQLELTDATIGVSATSGVSALTFDVAGTLSILNQSIPANIRNSSLVTELIFSTNNGLEYFNAGLNTGGTLSYPLIDGVTVSLDSLNFNEDGFSSSASLIVRDGFFGLDGEVTTTGDITMNWNGKIINSDLRVASMNLEYANMGLNVTDLRMNDEGINFDTALLKLPDALGNQVIGVENGGIDNSGNFYGDFVIGVLTVDILGCQIELDKPALDTESEKITCDSALFILPEALGSAEIGLNNVSIDQSGLNISGGSFTLPDINAGGLQFSNMGATLIINGEDYEIGATGKVFIAGIGEVEAEIALVNIQRPDYPIGLKYASFGFETKVGGLPLGATGLLLTGVRGSLAFGPPGVDLPEYYRDKFGSGMRIELGVTIVDAVYTVRGTSDLWMNVENFDFAIKGELEFLDNLFTAWAEALYTKSYGLELSAGVDVDLIDKIYIEGVIRAHIFEVANKAKFCSEITANVSVKNIWEGYPEDPISLGRIGLEAGDFKDNRRGVKGYVTLDLFGTKGVYYGSDGTFTVGNVDHYTLLDADMRSLRSSNILRATTNKRYRLISSTPRLQVRSSGLIKTESSNRERIIFYVESEEGDPTLTAISPSGVRFNEGDNNVIVRRQENQLYLAVINPEDGEWDMEVSNLAAGSDYRVNAIGFLKNPEITLDTPTFNRELVGSTFTVEGSFQGYVEGENIISIYISREQGVFNGQEISTFVSDNNSSFSRVINTIHLDNGEYYLYAGIYDGKNPELYDYAEGSIIVNNDLEEMDAIDDLIAGVTDGRVVNISFTNPNGNKVKGFHLNITNNETGDIEQLNLGFLTKFTLSTLKDAERYTLSVIPYDNSGQLGEVSNEVQVDFTTEDIIQNSYGVTTSTVDIELGYDSKTDIVITPLSYTATDSSMDYVELLIDEIPAFITYKSNVERVKLDGVNSFELGLICLSDLDEVKTQPGEYSIRGRVRNIGNDSIEQSFVIPISIEYRTPEITNISPVSWHVADGTTLEIKGEGFHEESIVNIGGTDCEIIEQNPTTLWVTVPVLSSENSGILNISNPGSETGSKEIDLIKPSYSVKTIKDYTEIIPGGRGWLYSQIKTYNRFDSSVSFTLIDQPEGWNISISDKIPSNQNFVMEVQVPESAQRGNYTVTVESNGEEKVYFISVVDNYPNPTISALSSHAGNWGEVITIYGYGITKETEILFNSNSIETYDQSEDYIRFMVPEDVMNGVLSLVRDNFTSNGAEFEIKDDNFNIYPTTRHYDLKPGAEIKNRIFVRGYADYVDLELVTDTADITVISNKNSVTPNSDFEMDIRLANTIKTGLYHIAITGSGERNVKEQVISISVGDNIQFTDKTMVSGKIDLDYSDYLEVENSMNDYTFHLSYDSYLPHGLFLNSETGEIYGRPTQSGTFLFSINILESELRQNEKEFELVILDSGWFRIEGPDGNNRFNNITSPAEDETIWENSESNNIESLLSSGDNLYVINNSEIRVLNRFTGLTKYILEAETLKTQLLGSYIITLENRYNDIYNEESGIKEPEFEDSYLVIYQQDGGEELISYPGVTDFDTVNSTIYMVQSDNTVTVSLSDLESPITIEEDILQENSITTEHGMFSIDGNEIINMITGDITELTDNPYSFTTYDNGLYYVDNFGGYVEHPSGRETQTGIINPELAVGELFSVVYNNYEFVVINRETQNTVRNSVVIDELLLTRDKLFILNSGELTAYNLYTGNEIWSKTGNFHNLISGGSYLYIQDSDNIICIGGRSNISAPTTRFRITPSDPDGTNGYYFTNPVFDLTVTDPESYGIAEYSTNDTMYNRYTDPVTLNDGAYTLSYTAYDDEGLTEELTEVPLKIDTINPVTTMEISKTDRTNGHFISEVTYTLSAIDENSEVYQTWYSINGEENLYTEPVTIDQEGNYTFEWWSIDMAGNVESTQEHSVSIDLYTPVTSMEIEKTDGNNNHITSPVTYTLSSTDSNSGVYQTWYSINGEENLYTEPVTIPEEGNYTFKWWSIDMAGNREMNQEHSVSIDLYAPVTTMEVVRTDGTNSHITSNVTYILSSIDSHSGVYETWYSINGETELYSNPVTIDQEGNYTFEWWSIDMAGNREVNQEHSVSIDLYTPVTTMEVEKTDGTNDHIVSPVTYTLSSTDSHSGVYQTWYSINGEESLYTEPVTIPEEGNYTFEWWSIDMAGNVEPKQEDSISIDLYTPVTTMEVEKTDGTNGHVTSQVTYTLSSTDSHSGVYQTWYSINGEESLYTEPVTIPEEGNYTFEWWSIDMAGNIEPKQEDTISIDLYTPETTMDIEKTDGTNSHIISPVTYTLSSTDSHSGVYQTWYSINGEAELYTEPVTITEEGNYTFEWWSIDIAGNRESKQEHSVSIDLHTPVTSMEVEKTDGANNHIVSHVTYTLSSTDSHSGVYQTWYSINGEAELYTEPVTIPEEGNYTFKWWSIDMAGNRELNQEHSVSIDLYTPVTTMKVEKTDGTNGHITSPVTYTLSSTDSHSGVYQNWYSINGEIELYTVPVTIAEEGNYTFKWWSIDMAGNVEPKQVDTISIDLYTPVTTMKVEKTDGTNGHITSPVTYTLCSTDSHSGVYQTWYSINGEESLYTEPVTIPEEGSYTFKWWSIDMAGNREINQEHTVSIDLHTPVTSMEVEKTDGTNNHIVSHVTYTLSSIDSHSGVYQTWYSINGEAELYTEPVTIPEEGNYTFEWWSIDMAGNRELNQEHSVSIDLYTPVTTMEVEKTDGTNGHITSPVTYTLSSTDSHSGVYQNWYSINGEIELYTVPITIAEEGNYTFEWWSIDMAGNVEPKQEDTISIDLYTPETTMEVEKTDGDGGYTISPVTYTLSVTDSHSGVYQTWYSINGEENLYTKPVTIPEEGNYTFKWWSIDMAGNTEVKQSHSVAIDLNNPTIRYESYEEREFGSIYFFAEDTFSEVNRIEYKVNGSEIQNYHDPLFLPIGETYNVSYRAIDNSERVSEWFDIVMDLSTIKPVTLIQNLTTAWSNRIISVDQDMQIGDEFYTKKNRGDKRDNTIKSLPAYLVGGEMILNEYNNKNSWDKNFYQFTAGVTIDLYLIKNKDSELDLDDTWTLVDEDVEINEEFYPGGGDVYHKIVEEGEYVEIGGSKIWKKSGPNLIVAQRNAKADMNIFSPNPSKGLTPLSTNWYASTSIEVEISRNWSYRLYGEEWVDLGSDFSGEFNLGYITDDTTLELRIEIIAQNPVDSSIEDFITKTRIYTVDKKAELTLVEPVSGSQILKFPTPLDYITTDVYGEEFDTEVSWTADNGEVTTNMYSAENPGVTTLTGSFEIYDDIRESFLQFNVVDEYQTETFTFGLGDTDIYSEKENGRYYGFSSDHKERLGETTYVDVPYGKYWSNNRVTRSYIALRENDNFCYLVNNGTYRVTALVGPVTRREDPFLRIEGEIIFMDAPYYSQIYTIETTIEVNDNKITIEGSEDLQLIELQILRTDQLGATTVTQHDNYRIMNDMKWYKWDPGHYYPDLKWDWVEGRLISQKLWNKQSKRK